MITLLFGLQMMGMAFNLTEPPMLGASFYRDYVWNAKEEKFEVEELWKYPDVKKFLVSRRAESFLKTGKEIDAELFERYQLNDQLPKKEYKNGMTAEIEAQIATRYGIKLPDKQEVIRYEQKLVVDRSEDDHSISRVRIMTTVMTHTESSSTDLLVVKGNNE